MFTNCCELVFRIAKIFIYNLKKRERKWVKIFAADLTQGSVFPTRAGRLTLLLLALLLAVFLTPGSASASDNTPVIILNGSRLDFEVPPTIEGGRVLVPLRTIFEALEAEVGWDKTTQTVTANRASTRIELTIGEPYAYINGVLVNLDTPARTINSRTLVPLRFVSEALGASVAWDGSTSTVTITSEDQDELSSLLGQPSEWDTYEEPDGEIEDDTPLIDEILDLL